MSNQSQWLLNYNAYSKFRPVYKDYLIQIVLDFLKQKIPENEWHIAADVGCGTGEGTSLLVPHFKKCYGLDISQQQIQAANDKNVHDNLIYMTGSADNLPVESNSVQLLTAFKSAQFFDRQKFFKESDRVLVRNGVVAFVAYNQPQPIDPTRPEDQRLRDWFESAYSDPRLQPFKSPCIVSLEQSYRDITFPDNYESVHLDQIGEDLPARADTLLGYIQSWGFFQRFAETNGQTANEYLRECEEKLRDIVETNDLSQKKITMRINYFIAMASKSH